MSDLVAEWLAAQGTDSVVDATYKWLLSQVGPEFARLTIPELWQVHLTGLGYTGALGDQFAKYYEDNAAPAELRNPFYAAAIFTAPPVVGSRLHWRVLIESSQNAGDATASTEIEFRTTRGVGQTASGGTASASSEFGGQPVTNCFNGNFVLDWATAGGAVHPHWAAYQFATPVPCSQLAYSVGSSPALAPKDFKVQYSDDGLSWTTALSVTNEPAWSASETRTYNV